MSDPKRCKYCGNILERKRKGGKFESLRNFTKRSFCDMSCGAKFQHANKKLERIAIVPVATNEDFSDNGKNQTAAQFLESVVNNKSVDMISRITAAKALLPYQSKKAGETGKKQEKDEAAKKSGKGRFSVMTGPKVVSFNQ